MAGYFQRLNGHVYEGAYKAGETLANGEFVEITGGVVKKITAAGDAEFRIEEKTTLWGLPALRLTCVKEGDKEIYFVENEWEIKDLENDYDESLYTVDAGHFVKMRMPERGDQLIMSVTDVQYAAATVGATVKPASGGSVA